MGRILLLAILFSLLLASLLWGQEIPMQGHGEELSALSDRFLHYAKNRDWEGARESLERIETALGAMPPYLLADEGVWQQVREMILLTEKGLSSGPQGEESWLDSLALYYLLDSVTHPFQPLWLASAESWVKGWNEAGLEERLKQYQVLRPAMKASLGKEAVQALDRLVSKPNVTGGELKKRLEQAMAEREARRKNRSFQILLLLFAAIAATFGYVAWRKRRMAAISRESAACSRPE